ncbi:MAG: FtsX-like permease family protein [Ignavibacteriaceae bacterium]
MQSVILFSSIGFLILIIAGINFINLSTARANRRVKEIGIRKTIGAYQRQLRFQFLQESLLLTFIAAAIAIIILSIFLDIYNSTFTKDLSILSLLQHGDFLIFLGITLSIGIIAGYYPAIYLSKYDPSGIFKSSKIRIGRKSGLRRNMVMFQFIISVSLLICMSIEYQQMKFIHTKSVGFQKENIITFPARSSTVSKNFKNFKTRLLSNSSILSVCGSTDLPGDPIYSNGNLYDGEDNEIHFSSVFMSCNYDFITTYKIPIIAGRNFSRDFSADTTGTIILNETAVNKLGITLDQAIGKVLNRGINNSMRIIGVVKDFNFQSLLYRIEPMAFFLEPNYISAISVRIAPSNIIETLDFIRDSWKSSFPGEQFEYSFLDQRLEQLYQGEQKTQSILIIFTVMSFLIACLGLFGLTTLWLQNFAYRVTLDWWMFLISGGIAIIIALATVSTQVIKAAIANPVESLKYE